MLIHIFNVDTFQKHKDILMWMMFIFWCGKIKEPILQHPTLETTIYGFYTICFRTKCLVPAITNQAPPWLSLQLHWSCQMWAVLFWNSIVFIIYPVESKNSFTILHTQILVVWHFRVNSLSNIRHYTDVNTASHKYISIISKWFENMFKCSVWHALCDLYSVRQ